MKSRRPITIGLVTILGLYQVASFMVAPAIANATVVSSDSVCNQVVGSATGVTARRLSTGDCLVTFTETGSTTWTVPSNVTFARVLVVGGGGGGAGKYSGNLSGAGGGGAGGVYDASNYPLTSGSSISITVGAGGVAGQTGDLPGPLVGRQGATTYFGALSAGGGGGGGYDATYTYLNALTGATAGGGGGGSSNYWNANTYGAGAAGETLTVGSQIYPGRKGGNGAPWTTKNSSGGDAGPGGGASAAPSSGIPGAGITSAITETSTVYGTGGRARVNGVTWTFAATGLIPGNGGDGWDGSTEANAVNCGGNGANGIVIIRYTPNVHNVSPASGTFEYRRVNTLTFTATLAGKVIFLANGKRIPGCINRAANAGNSYTISCAYSPSFHGRVVVTTTFTPTDSAFVSSSKTNVYGVSKRTNAR